MSEEATTLDKTQLLTLTAQIVAAHVAGNSVTSDALPGLIQSVHTALSGVGTEPAPVERQEPAVPVKRSIHQDYLVCLEDGAKMKMLKRYIAKRYNLTPAQYRAKWGLAADYPMVAPGYAERRSALAKEIGLGRKPKEDAPVKAKGRPGPKPGSKRRAPAVAEAEGA